MVKIRIIRWPALDHSACLLDSHLVYWKYFLKWRSLRLVIHSCVSALKVPFYVELSAHVGHHFSSTFPCNNAVLIESIKVGLHLTWPVSSIHSTEATTSLPNIRRCRQKSSATLMRFTIKVLHKREIITLRGRCKPFIAAYSTVLLYCYLLVFTPHKHCESIASMRAVGVEDYTWHSGRLFPFFWLWVDSFR